MSRFTTKLVLLLLCGGLPLMVSGKGKTVTKFTLDFLGLFLGNFNNENQIRNGASGLAHIHYKHVPVHIPALRQAPIIYSEWVVNDQVSQTLVFVSQQPGPAVHLDIYEFTDPSSFKPDEFNVSTLYNFTKKDVRGGNCTAVYNRLARAVYVGAYPECNQLVNGIRPLFGNTYVCIGSSSVPPTATSNSAQPPYIFDRVGDRYPTIGYPDTYDSMCKRNSTCLTREQLLQGTS